AIAVEPLYESAQATLIAAHLAEGNRTEAIRQFTAFRRLLYNETGLAPSPSLFEELESALAEAAHPQVAPNNHYWSLRRHSVSSRPARAGGPGAARELPAGSAAEPRQLARQALPGGARLSPASRSRVSRRAGQQRCPGSR